eukprot:CFRG1631T1
MASQRYAKQADVERLLSEVDELEKQGILLYEAFEAPENTTIGALLSLLDDVVQTNDKLIADVNHNGLSNINLGDMGGSTYDDVEAMIKTVRASTDSSNRDLQDVTARITRAQSTLKKPKPQS